MEILKLVVKALVLGSLGIGALFLIWVQWSTYDFDSIQKESVQCRTVPGFSPKRLQAGQTLKILSWNVQYMAGKNYVFYYDLLDGSGPDLRPKREDIEATYRNVARVIKEEDPDVILLQELDEDAARTDYENQLERLLTFLPKEYRCSTSSFYWRSKWVPHPKILGSVGLKLALISKYEFTDAVRHQLPIMRGSFLFQKFNLKRAILEARFPVEGLKGGVALLNTHLDAFAQGQDTMQRQVAKTSEILDSLTLRGVPWMIGGDFNLLPPGKSYSRLEGRQLAYFKPSTELEPFFAKYNAIPSLENVDGPDWQQWLTHFPNDPEVKTPDRTIDYLFSSKDIAILESRVRQGDTWKISDHLPIVARVKLPEQ